MTVIAVTDNKPEVVEHKNINPSNPQGGSFLSSLLPRRADNCVGQLAMEGEVPRNKLVREEGMEYSKPGAVLFSRTRKLWKMGSGTSHHRPM